MREYCPNCAYFRDLESGSRENPPLGEIDTKILEDEKGAAKYGCYSPAWVHPMPLRITDLQLLRAIGCGSFFVREEGKKNNPEASVGSIPVPTESCIYEGPANPNAVNTVKTAITCHEGEQIRVYVVGGD